MNARQAPPTRGSPALSRREFLRAFGRWAGLAGLLAGASGLVLKNGAAPCAVQRSCKGCPLLANCKEPAAQAVRRKKE